LRLTIPATSDVSTTAAKTIYAICQCGVISLLAKFGSSDVVGQFGLGVAISAPVLMFLRASRSNDGAGSRATDIRVMSLVFALLGIAAVGFLEQSVQERMTVVLAAMVQAVEWVADMYAGRRSARSLWLHGTFSIAALAFAVFATGRIGMGLLAMLIVRLALLFFHDFRVARVEAYQSASMLACVAASVPCYFVAHILGYRALGVFFAMASLIPVVQAPVSGLGRTATPYFAKLFDDGDKRGLSHLTVQLARAGLMLGLCAMAAAALCGRWIGGAIFGLEYASQSALLMALAAVTGVGFVSTLLDAVVIGGRRSYEQIPLALAGALATALGAIAMVPRAGLPGAAFAVGLGILVRIAGQAWVLRSILRQPRRAVLLDLLRQPVG
jgi:O-antigen/teichoic acid export membrane protein